MNENINIMKSNWEFIQKEEKTEEERLVEEIMDTMQEKELFCTEIEEFIEVKEKLENQYERISKSDLVGKDLIADYISEKIMEIDRRIK